MCPEGRRVVEGAGVPGNRIWEVGRGRARGLVDSVEKFACSEQVVTVRCASFEADSGTDEVPLWAGSLDQ